MFTSSLETKSRPRLGVLRVPEGSGRVGGPWEGSAGGDQLTVVIEPVNLRCKDLRRWQMTRQMKHWGMMILNVDEGRKP